MIVDFTSAFPVQYHPILPCFMLRLLPVLFAVFCITSCGTESEQARMDYALAQQYSQGTGVEKNPEKAYEYLVKAESEGSSKAGLDLGYLYLQGAGVTKDPTKAIEYFQTSARRGNRDAMYNLGLAYVHGDGVSKDLSKAATWFTKAAYLGDSGAQFNIGLMYLNGEGVKQDPVMAYAWFTLSAEQEYKGAKGILGITGQGLTPEQSKQTSAMIQTLKSKVQTPK